LKDFRTSIQTRKSHSIETLSEDADDYLETCPIYHDVDSQSIYGFDIIQHPLRKSDEILWKDREFELISFKIYFDVFSLSQSITNFKFQNHRQLSFHQHCEESNNELEALII
jgi:hypothetical protein